MANKIQNNNVSLKEILATINALPEGIELDELSNPGSATTMLEGTEMLDGTGKKVMGTIESKDSSNLTISGATMNVPAGYYAEDATTTMPFAEWESASMGVNEDGVVRYEKMATSSGYVLSGTDHYGTYQLPTQSAITITPTKSSQTAVTSGKYTTGDVTVAAIPLQYEDITTPLVELNTANGGVAASTMGDAVDNTETYINNQATLIAQIEDALQGKVAAAPVLQSKTITPTTSSQIITPDFGYDGLSDVKIAAIPSTYVQPVSTKTTATYMPTTSNQIIAAGTYCSGDQTIKGDANLKAENIAEGTSIFGVAGTHSGGGNIETCEVTFINNADESYDCYGIWVQSNNVWYTYQATAYDGDSTINTTIKNSFIIVPSSNVTVANGNKDSYSINGQTIILVGDNSSITITIS